MITLSGKRASDLANAALPGSGYLLTVLIVFGGLVFNTQHRRCRPGLNSLLGVTKIGA